MNGISPWAIKANAVFAEDEPETFNLQSGEFTFNGHITPDSLWVYVSWANSANLGFRPVYLQSPPKKGSEESESVHLNEKILYLQIPSDNL